MSWRRLKRLSAIALDNVVTCGYISAVKTHYKAARPKRAAARETQAVYSVREAKAHFSKLIRLAAEGGEITVTSHGHPAVRMVAANKAAAKPFTVDFKWLRTMRVGPRQTPSEQIIRGDRDVRG